MRRSRNVTRRVARRSKVARRSRVARRTAKVARKRRSNTRKVSKRNRRNNTRRVRRGGADAAREEEADRQFAEFQASLRRQQMPGEPAADPQQRGRAHRTTLPAMSPEEYARLNPRVPISRVAYNPTEHSVKGLSVVAEEGAARGPERRYFYGPQ